MFYGKGCEHFTGKWDCEEIKEGVMSCYGEICVFFECCEKDKSEKRMLKRASSSERKITPVLTYCYHKDNPKETVDNCNYEDCPRRDEFNKILDDMINEWHKTETILKLNEYLGMTDAEYMRWIHTKEIPDGVFGLDKFQDKIK